MGDIIAKGPVLIRALKNVDLSQRIVSGYYTAFGNEDSDGDIGVKGMTLKSVAETGPKSLKPRIKHFLNHRTDQPIGLPLDMGEDDFGAHYTSQIGTHNLGTDFLKMADCGLISEHSYGLTPLLRDPKDKRRMLQVKVWEFSPLTAWGANSETPIISLGKSLTKEEQIQYWVNKQAAIEKFCRNTDATDETIQSLLIEIKFLTQHIIDLSTTTQTADQKASDPPGTQDYTGLLAEIQSIKF